MSTLEFSEALAALGRSSWKNVHNCKLCPYFSTSLVLMVNHVRRHRSTLEKFTCSNPKIESYYCKDCDFQTELTILFKQHINKYHGLKRGDLSSEDFSIQNYVCEKCHFQTNFLFKWLQHSSTCVETKVNLQNLSKRYACSDCPFRSHYSSCLREHSRLFHLGDEHKCEKCIFKTGSKSVLKKHVHNNDVEWCKCDECSFKTKCKRYLTFHGIYRHLNLIQYKCEQCPFKTKRKADLELHLSRFHSKQNDVGWSEKCPFKAKSGNSLKQHPQLIHLNKEDVKWFECANCSYRTKARRNLVRHVKVHSEIKPYQCEYCPYEAKRINELKCHINCRHLNGKDVKWYKCEQCSYKTKYGSSLYKHNKAHEI
ncbi:putative zinc finger protein 66 [Zophobas morio]|uniref:putative zinc finger protein 66 n=1 Tax=Zophobas morio TaxID=2755281 RepID=UPI003083B115